MSIDTKRKKKRKQLLAHVVDTHPIWCNSWPHDTKAMAKKKRRRKQKPPTLHVQCSSIHFIQWYFKIKCDCCIMKKKTLSNVINSMCLCVCIFVQHHLEWCVSVRKKKIRAAWIANEWFLYVCLSTRQNKETTSTTTMNLSCRDQPIGSDDMIVRKQMT